MAVCRKLGQPLLSSRASLSSISIPILSRHSSSTAQNDANVPLLTKNGFPIEATEPLSPISRLSTSVLLRRSLMCTFLSSPILFTPGLAILQRIANTKSKFFNPDKNRLLRRLIKPFIYDQFCAGTNSAEVHTTASDIKSLGFSGVALCYSKEAGTEQLEDGQVAGQDPELIKWKDGTLETLDMIGAGDWLGVKMTGAGQRVLNALVQNEPPPSDFVEAMHTICEKAAKQGCRIWMDAEQQAFQSSIDAWTIDLMRYWNKGHKPVIYNTTQAYLKQSRVKLERHLRLAGVEGWILGVKLVRGAYIWHDRKAIHDTKAETDESYECIVRDLLKGTFPGLRDDGAHQFELLLCGHNPGTIARASALATELCNEGKLKVYPEFAQLQGMADDIGCELVQKATKIRQSNAQSLVTKETFAPRVYKCLTWGTIQECMAYLVRRAIENRGALDRIKDDKSMFAGELRRRLARTFAFR